MTVYADILFIVNLYIDAMLLSAVRRFMRLPLSRLRWLLGSVLGGFFGLTALLPQLRGLPLLLFGLCQAFLLVTAAFAPKPWHTLGKATLLLLLFGAALSGLLSLVQSFLPLSGMVLRNGTVYFDISPLLLVLLTCAAYGVLYLFDRLFQKREPDVLFSTVHLTHSGKSVQLSSKIDTGMTLREPFSGLPVILVHRSAVKDLLPPNFGTADCPLPFRLIPFSSVGGTGVLPAFSPDAVTVNGRPVRCWAAVCEKPLSAGVYDALISADLAPNTLKEDTL